MPPAHYGPFLLKKGIYLVGGGAGKLNTVLACILVRV